MKRLSGKPQMLKEVNSSMIEQLVFENGPLSKPELAKRTGLSLPTINKLVDDLEKNARLCPAGRIGEGVGRKAMLYETNRNAGCLLACYYQDGAYLCRLADMLNNTLYEERFPFDFSSAKLALASTFRAIDTLMEQAPAPVKIIGVGLPGVVQPDGCLLAIPQIPVWEGVNLEKALSARYKTAIYIENGVNLSAMGYYYAHLNEKPDNLVYLYVGNGFGSGIILNRRLYQGSGNFSGEIGFMAESNSTTKQNYAADGGYMEFLLGSLIDYSTGEFRQNNTTRRNESIAILTAIVVNHVAVLNPGVIVLSGKIFDKRMIGAIGRRMAHYLPSGIMPRLVRDFCNTTGLEGLIQSCRRYITTGIHLVQRPGLPQLADSTAE
jgi:predicted NBD/HSP70 family sugar kinase